MATTTEPKPAHLATLRDLDACREARAFAAGFADPQAAWDACERGDWMLWLVGRLSSSPETPARRKVMLVAALCARLATPITDNAECEAARLHCLDVCERYGRGDAGVSLENVRTARTAAYASAAATACAHAAYAAYAAARAATAATDTACAAFAAARAATAAARAARAAATDTACADSATFTAFAADDADDADDARAAALKKCADIVRENYPTVPTVA